MGTVVYQDGFKIIIRAKELGHKHMPHCHVMGSGSECRIHLNTFDVLTNRGFSLNDMKKILEAVRYYQRELLEKWEEFHGQE